ncbi:DNA polymerase/3'-5' exonuclease PolX [Candidatus Jorgensenbacteria bacterium]|nr:DNA polymerase/3'-5' exonuclease PolX [Candidatus Jorgensenbacteria bacterium]
MTNRDIARLFYEIAAYLEMQAVPFKPRAYEKVAEVIENLNEEAGLIYERGGSKALGEIPGVGVSIAEKIEELLRTGSLKYYKELKKKTPVDLNSFRGIEGLGAKSIAKLYRALNVKNIADLEKAALSHKIRAVESFGEKSEENILKGIEFVKKSSGRFVLGFVMPLVREIESRLRGLKEVDKIVVAGSVRRRKETIGDIDILVISKKPNAVMDFFVAMPEVARVYAHGETKSAIKLNNGLDVDLRVVGQESYGAALNYFTGSKEHNVALREMAIKRRLKLNEYGLFKKKSNREMRIACKTEEELYDALGLAYIEPELRENNGEIEAAILKDANKKSNLPKLVGYGDLYGDLQIQSNWTDGANSIEEMAKTARGLGLEYIAITDHTKRLAMTHGLDDERIKDQWKEIDAVNSKFKSTNGNKKFKILKGTECDILKDGSLDLSDSVLSRLDVVGVSVHSYFNLSRKEQTERIKRAMENPHVDILFHPTGRIIKKREAYDIDIDDIIRSAKKTGTILEIDAYPDRLDLKDEYVRKCVDAGVKLTIDSDAHSVSHLAYIEYGISQARRGWATREDIVNAWPFEKMLQYFKR